MGSYNTKGSGAGGGGGGGRVSNVQRAIKDYTCII